MNTLGKILIGLAIGILFAWIVFSTIQWLIPIVFILAFFGVVFLLIKPSKK